MRAFIAIELPEDVRNALVKLQEKLKTSGADVKWVEPENIHLTLKFLGEVSDEIKDKVTAALKATAADNAAYQASLGMTGAFPNIEYPRVIWAGITEGDAETKKIVHELEDKLSRAGIAKEVRPFASHITLGRVRTPSGRKNLARMLEGQAQELTKLNLKFSVSALTLFKSDLSPKGPVYSAQERINLKTS